MEDLVAAEAVFMEACHALKNRPMPEPMYDEARMLSMVRRAYEMNLRFEDINGLTLDELIELVGAQAQLRAVGDVMAKHDRLRMLLRRTIGKMEF